MMKISGAAKILIKFNFDLLLSLYFSNFLILISDLPNENISLGHYQLCIEVVGYRSATQTHLEEESRHWISKTQVQDDFSFTFIVYYPLGNSWLGVFLLRACGNVDLYHTQQTQLLKFILNYLDFLINWTCLSNLIFSSWLITQIQDPYLFPIKERRGTAIM